MADASVILDSTQEIARKFASQRRGLDPQDFKVLRDAGFLMTGVPAERGGLWIDHARSTRPSPRSSECSPGANPPSGLSHPCARLSSRFGSALHACRLLSLTHASHNARRSRSRRSPGIPGIGGGQLLPSPAAAVTSREQRQSPDSTGVENGGFRARNTSVQVRESRRSC
jgi:hypothetical protein